MITQENQQIQFILITYIYIGYENNVGYTCTSARQRQNDTLSTEIEMLYFWSNFNLYLRLANAIILSSFWYYLITYSVCACTLFGYVLG